MQIKRNLTSFCRLHVLAAQDLHVPLLACALFLGYAVGNLLLILLKAVYRYQINLYWRVCWNV